MSLFEEGRPRERGGDTFSTTFYVFPYQPACGWAGTVFVDQQAMTKPAWRGSTLVLLPRKCQCSQQQGREDSHALSGSWHLNGRHLRELRLVA
jgi:hypothetical protein